MDSIQNPQVNTHNSPPPSRVEEISTQLPPAATNTPVNRIERVMLAASLLQPSNWVAMAAKVKESLQSAHSYFKTTPFAQIKKDFGSTAIYAVDKSSRWVLDKTIEFKSIVWTYLRDSTPL